MTDLERRLVDAAAAAEWPPTPHLAPPEGAPRRGPRPAIALAAALLAALGIAFAVPGARSAILRAFHLEGVTVERVSVLPPAQERPLGEALGSRITAAEAEQVLGRAFALPRSAGTPTLRLSEGVVSAVLAGPVLLSELRNDYGPAILKKLAGGSTDVESVDVDGASGFWITGGAHVFIAPGAPPRLAGNVLLWVSGHLIFRLEGRNLTRERALEQAREIAGT